MCEGLVRLELVPSPKSHTLAEYEPVVVLVKLIETGGLHPDEELEVKSAKGDGSICIKPGLVSTVIHPLLFVTFSVIVKLPATE